MTLTKDDMEAIAMLIKQGTESIRTEQQDQGKTLKYLKGKVNKIAKTVDIIGRRYDERIVENWREIDKIKHFLKIPSHQ